MTPEPLELRTVRQLVDYTRRHDPFGDDGTTFTAYTDGSCLSNPDGPAGFAAIVESASSGRSWRLAEHLPSSTNNRAEWAGLAAALLFVPTGSQLEVLSDSQYVLNVASGLWKRKANLDLWQAWDELRRSHPVALELRWVRGHAADRGNEEADALATLAAYNFDKDAWKRARQPREPNEQARELLRLARGDWEQRFVRDVAARLQRGIRLSPKQQAILDRIAARGKP